MFTRIVLFIFLLIFGFEAQSQISYHRFYETSLPPDTFFYHMNTVTTTGNVNALGTVRTADDNVHLVLTQHDVKGNLKYDKLIDLGQDTVDIVNIAHSSVTGSGDSILFIANAIINDEPKEILGKMALDGSGVEVKSIFGTELSDFNQNPLSTPFAANSDVILTSRARPTIDRLGSNFEVLWSRVYDFTNEDGDVIQNAILDLESSVDTTLFITGSTTEDNRFLAAELDSFGVQLWSNSYVLSSASTINAYEVAPLENGNVAIAGSYFQNGLENGFVTILDTSGTAILSTSVNISGADETAIQNIIVGEDSNLWFSGTYMVGDSLEYFTSSITTGGSENWTSIYNNTTAITDDFTTSLISNSTTGGATLIANSFLDNEETMVVMKHDDLGVAMCSDTLSLVLSDIEFVRDTVLTEV